MFKKLFIIAALVTGVALAQVSTTGNRVSYSGNGSTTAFSYPNKFFSDSDLVVIDRTDATGAETTKTLTTHYTVTGATATNGGTVTMLTAPASGHSLIIYQDPSRVQDLDLDENDALPPEQLEKRLDKLVIQNQRDKSRIDRSVRLSESHPTFDPTLPALLTADQALVVNSTADGFDLADISAITSGISSLTGDVTTSGSGAAAATIAANAVTNAKLATVATQTFKGRTTGGTGDVEDLTATQATALLNNVVGDSGSGGTKGLVPAPSAGDAAAGKFLKADGTWATAGGTITGGTNLGASGSSVFSTVNGANMEFRKIVAGTNVTITQNTNDITIDSTASGSGDVVGPGSATDSNVAVFDGATGKIIADSGILINDLQTEDADLTAVAGLSSNGLIARTGSGTASARTVTGTANQITVTNGDGVSGNPTLSIPSDPSFPGDRITIGGAVDLVEGTVDPTSSAVSAGKGSLYLNSSNGNLYRKNDAGSTTNWTAMVGISQRTFAAQLAAPSGGSCTVTEKGGNDWINGNATSSGTGRCAITINAGIFSEAPSCVCTSQNIDRICSLYTSSTSTSAETVVYGGSVATNEIVQIMCTGAQ